MKGQKERIWTKHSKQYPLHGQMDVTVSSEIRSHVEGQSNCGSQTATEESCKMTLTPTNILVEPPSVNLWFQNKLLC